jgi:hypothetical protein
MVVTPSPWKHSLALPRIMAPAVLRHLVEDVPIRQEPLVVLTKHFSKGLLLLGAPGGLQWRTLLRLDWEHKARPAFAAGSR